MSLSAHKRHIEYTTPTNKTIGYQPVDRQSTAKEEKQQLSLWLDGPQVSGPTQLSHLLAAGTRRSSLASSADS